MRELRFIAVSDDGSQLILQDNDTESVMTLPLDERVQAAVRGDRRPGQPEQPGSTLRPRDIQARVRAGQTAEELAESAGVPLDKVLRFAGPVLAERAHVADRAQSAVIRGSATDAPNRPLSEVVGEWVSRSDVDPESVQWDAFRRDDGKWQVIAAWYFDESVRHARFLFDPTGRSVVPDDAEARRIAGLVEPEDEAVPEPVAPQSAGQARLSVVSSEPDEEETPALSVAPEPEEDEAEEPPSASATETSQTTFDEDEHPTAPVPMTAQRAARGRRRGRTTAPGDRLRLTDIADNVEEDGPRQRAAGAASGADSAPAQPPAETPSKPRSGKKSKKPTVPSWDEIMFGRADRSD